MRTWRNINATLSKCSEEEVYQMIQEERQTGRRISVLLRLHQRYCVLRTARERIELLGEAHAS